MSGLSLTSRLRGALKVPVRKYAGHRTLESVIDTVETLLRMRGDVGESAVRVSDLPAIAKELLDYQTTTGIGGGGGGGTVAWGDVTGKPATFPPSAHTHPYAPISETEILVLWKFAYATCYKEYTYASGQLTGIGIWTTAGKTLKLFTRTFSYTGTQLTSMTTVDEISAKTLTKTFSYTGSQLTTATGVIA